jgi:hypothetical protein
MGKFRILKYKIMKQTLTILLLSIIMIGCGEGNTKHQVISKIFKNNGICGYYYNDGFGTSYTEDSCNKYFVGDSITFKK